ncbi:MAG: hypothetical protein II225_04320, partial [Ruminococcus sp.]|nr:hypothetical protein [Ruminococcus sp.]
ANGIDKFIDFVNTHGGQMSQSKLYYSLMVDGYKYIFLASDNGDGAFSAEQLQWLDAELADNETNNNGKPVFIYTHYVPSGSVLSLAGGKITNTNEFAAVTGKYNNVICFSGHGLASMRSIGNVYGGDENLPVVINASSTARTRRYIGSETTNFEDYDNNSAEGIYVRTYEDKVVVLGRDFTAVDPETGETKAAWIPEASCVIYNQDVSAQKDLLLEFGESVAASDYITNPNGRTIKSSSSDTRVATVSTSGKITVADDKEGTTVVTNTALATDSQVVTMAKTNVRVVEKKDYSYYIKGSFDNWGDGYYMKPASDETVVSASITLEAGTYDFNLKSFDDVYGADAEFNDTTDALTLVKNGTDNFVLNATGGTYTFTYNTSTAKLTVTHTPLQRTSLTQRNFLSLLTAPIHTSI